MQIRCHIILGMPVACKYRSMRILVDLDGTVCDTLPDWLDCIYQRTGIRAWAHQIIEWEMKHNDVLSALTDAELYAPLHEPGFFF